MWCSNTSFAVLVPRVLVTLIGWLGLVRVVSSEANAVGGLRDLAPWLQTGSGLVQSVMRKPEVFRLQVLLTEVVGRRGGEAPRLRRYGYRVDAEYFYPASAIKLCAAVAALQTIEELERGRLCGDLLEVPMEIAPLFPGDAAQLKDETNREGGQMTVGQELRKLAMVSDNRAFNRLFDLVGHADLNARMHALGLNSVVINHRLSEGRSIPDPLASAAVRFRLADALMVEIPARESRLRLRNEYPGLRVGQAFMEGERRVDRPMDFTDRNRISLMDLQNLLIKLCRPEIVLGTRELELRAVHRRALVEAMTVYPRESANPLYAASEHPDHACKFLLPGVRRVLPTRERGERVEVTAKIGRAYGFTVENSCLVEPRDGRTLFVAAVLYTNADGVLNDDRYEYAEIADPFFADLGEMVARRWLRGE